MNDDQVKSFSKKVLIILLSYIALVVVFWFIGKFNFRYSTIEMPYNTESDFNLGELLDNNQVEQRFVSRVSNLSSVKLSVATFGRENTGKIKVEVIREEDGVVLAEDLIDVSSLEDNSVLNIQLENQVQNVLGVTLILRITPINSKQGNAITFYGTLNEDLDSISLTNGGQVVEGQLCYSIAGTRISWAGQNYWVLMSVPLLLILLYWFVSKRNIKKGKYDPLMSSLLAISKYKFLVKQLVMRDFKTKYKRSFFGMFWSVLNPLLTMSVQYIVFSKLFNSDIEYFAAYLMTGIVLFGFFNEAITVGLGAIVGNASLINKVYVPKYIYPITKVISTTVNLFISLIPLLAVAAFSGVKIKLSITLLPFVIICLLLFTIGIALMLSSAMVFFRDTQFLWGIVSMIWMYLSFIQLTYYQV